MIEQIDKQLDIIESIWNVEAKGLKFKFWLWTYKLCDLRQVIKFLWASSMKYNKNLCFVYFTGFSEICECTALKL